MAMTLSAVMIVRDEERFLDPCLASIRGLVDEIVVVDTGSCDRTREIAAGHGARLCQFSWRHDFAAARNFAIDQANGSWLLYIDADERVRGHDRGRLANALADERLIACTVRFHPRTGFTAYPEHRLFRRDPRIRFAGAIHETIMPSIREVVLATGASIGTSDLTIDHVGYDGDQSHKLDRNLRILLSAVEENPRRAYLWWHLGTVWRDLGCPADAEAAWRRGVGVARANATGHQPAEGLCFVELAKVLLGRGEDALELIEQGLALKPDNWLLHALKAKALIAARRYADALPVLEALAGVQAESLVDDLAYDSRIFGASAFADLALCAFRLGRYGQSQAWYARAAALEPDSLEYRTKQRLAAARARAG
jgi:tetratricopeptide (TPR) repeat protein